MITTHWTIQRIILEDFGTYCQTRYLFEVVFFLAPGAKGVPSGHVMSDSDRPPQMIFGVDGGSRYRVAVHR